MKALLDWIDHRTGLCSAVRQCAGRTAPGGVSWQNVWPSVIVFTFVVQVITGLVLWMHYSPSAQTAWESVYYVQHHVTLGWLLRGIHHYAAQVLVALLLLYLIQMVLRGTYRAPRECVFWIGVFLGLFSLALCLTGDLLAWDQNSYAATMVRTKFLMLLPVVGGSLFKLAAGGPTFGHLTLTRFFALHVGVFASGFLALLALHAWVLHRARAAQDDSDQPASPYWPDQTMRNAVGCLVVMAVILFLVFQHAWEGSHAGQVPGDYLGVALGAPADPDPANFYAAARPEWSLRGVYEFSNLFPGSLKIVPIFIVPGMVLAVVLLFPLIGKIKVGHGFNVVVMSALLFGIVGLTVWSYVHDSTSAEYQTALSEGLADAHRISVLARSPDGIPVEGALSLLRSDPKTQGPKLYDRQCASCHNYTDADGNMVQGTSTRIGDFTFHNFNDSRGGFISGNSYSIGDITFHSFSDDQGDTVSGTSQQIGDFGFHNLNSSRGHHASGTSTEVGDFTFFDMTDDQGDTVSGSSTRIGDTRFVNTYQSRGQVHSYIHTYQTLDEDDSTDDYTTFSDGFDYHQGIRAEQMYDGSVKVTDKQGNVYKIKEHPLGGYRITDEDGNSYRAMENYLGEIEIEKE